MKITAVPPADAGVGLDFWMERVIERAARLADAWDAESVHDLRVALRRCRTMAETLREVNPDSGWRKIKKSSRDLFRMLGELRDTQVEREWIKQLAPPGEGTRIQMLRILSNREKREREAARNMLKDFSLKGWKKLARRVRHKAHLFPLDSVVFQRPALAKLAEANELFHRARRMKSGASWHRARIGLKQFRYIAENFLPRRYSSWAPDVKRIQDLLGDVHDLDVLASDLRRNFRAPGSSGVVAWLNRIKDQRKTRLAQVITITSGANSKLLVWRAGLEIAHQLAPSIELSRRSA